MIIVLARPKAKLFAFELQNMLYADIVIDYTFDKNFAHSTNINMKKYEYSLDKKFWFYRANFLPQLHTIEVHEIYHSYIYFDFVGLHIIMAYSETLTDEYVKTIKNIYDSKVDTYIFFDKKGFRSSYSTGKMEKINAHIYKIIT